MKIPYVNLGQQNSLILDELINAIKGVLKSGQFILGDEVHKFEERFANRVGTKYAVGLNNGTDALFLTMLAFGIGPGDEVITVPNSFLATVAAIELTGASSVLIDVDEDQNMDVTQLEEAITSHTKAVIPVHLTGRPAKMISIMEIANKHNLIVIEDCAQAVDASINEKFVGAYGHAGTFSLHPLKNLAACGDAGVVVTNDEDLVNKLRKLRNHGLINRDECEYWGFNSRLDALQAAILNVKLDHLNRWTERRREIAQMYFEGLIEMPITLPIEAEGVVSVYHAFVIRTDQRDELMKYLADNGIETKIHYPIPIHKQQAASKTPYSQKTFLRAEYQAKQILSLPIYPELTDEQVEYIIRMIKKYFISRKVGGENDVESKTFV